MLVDKLCRPIGNRLFVLTNNVKQPVVDIAGFSLPFDGESEESQCFSYEETFIE